jgi:AcrR family transcriptional regulator
MNARSTRGVPRNGSARAGKSAARRAAILAAALDEFCDKGFAAARVEDIALRAGVAKGTIYLNFKDKQALFEALIRSTLGGHLARLEAARPLPGASVRETVEAVALPLLEAARAGRLGDLIRLMIAESGRFPQLAEFYHREVIETAMAGVRRLARVAMAAGELQDDALLRFPQLMGGPVLVTLIWSTLFDRFAPLDAEGLLRAFLDLAFTPPSPSR